MELRVFPTSDEVSNLLEAGARQRGVVFDIDAVAMRDLEARLFAGAVPERTLLDAIEQRVLLRQLVDEALAKTREEEKELERALSGAGFVPSLEKTLVLLRKTGASLVNLRSGAPQLESRIRTIFALLEEFEAACEKFRVADEGWLRIEATRRLRERSWRQFDGLERFGSLRFVGAHDLYPARMELFEAIALHGEVVLEIPALDTPGKLFGAIPALLDRIEARADSSRISIEWTRSPIPEHEHRDCHSELWVTASPVDAARDAAFVARAWIEKEGIRPERLVVTSADFASRRAELVEAFVRAGVPIARRRRPRLSEIPFIRFLAQMIETAREGFPRDLARHLLMSSYARGYFFRARSELLSGLFDRVAPTGLASPNGNALVDALERVAKPSERSLLIPIRGFFTDAFDLSKASNWRQLAEVIDRILRTRPFPSYGNPEVAQAVATSLDESNLEYEIAACSGSDPVAAEVLLRKVHGLAESNVTATAFDVWRFFSDIIEGTQLDGPVHEPYGVRLASLTQVAAHEWDAVVVLGVEHGVFPSAPARDSLLTEFDRETLEAALRERRSAGSFRGLGEQAQRMSELSTFARAILSATKKLALVRSRSDRSGRPALESSVIALLREELGIAFEEHVVGAPPFPEPHHAYGHYYMQMTAVRAGLSEVLPDSVMERVEQEKVRMIGARRGLANGPHSGAVTPDLFEDDVLQLSATSLDRYAECPFHEFAERVIGLSDVDAAVTDPDLRLEGTLAHEMFAHTIERVILEGVTYSPDNARQVLEWAAPITTQIGAQWLDRQGAHREVARIAVERTQDQVLRLLRWLFEQPGGGRPLWVERAFGTDEAPFEIELGPSRKVRFRGRIDFAEERSGVLTVYDLKRGARDALRTRLSPNRLAQKHFQLPLYGAAVHAQVAAARDRQPAPRVDVGYLSLKDSAGVPTLRQRAKKGVLKVDGVDLPLDSFLRFFDERGAPTFLFEQVEAVVSRMEKGEFPIKPAKDACTHCGYASLCRIAQGAEEDEEVPAS